MATQGEAGQRFRAGSNLPGESARASLKREDRPGVHIRTIANLPGESARASLKPSPPATRAPSARRISRANRPGPH